MTSATAGAVGTEEGAEHVARTQADLDLGLPAVPFDASRSRCTAEGFTAADRADPFWHGMWGDGAQASWLTRPIVERLRAAGLESTRAPDTARTPAEAVLALADRGRRQRHESRLRQARLSALAAVGMWRTVTAEQLAAFTGHATAARPSLMVPAFQAGLTERGTFLSELPPITRRSHNHLYRPAESSTFDSLAERLSYAEWMALTAGVGWTRGPQHDRHNVLAAELALRVAEVCDVGTVLGEATSRLDLLATNTLTSEENRRADATIVRPDGHRIAIEVTSSVGTNFTRKVERWAQTLNDTDPRDVGLSVIFLDASTPDRPDRLRKGTWTSIRSTVGRVAYAIPGAVRRGVPERMAVARWEWWFPQARAYTEALLTLRAQRPTGPPSDRWETVHLLDPFDLESDVRDPAAAQAVIDNANGLWGVPPWLRNPERTPDFTESLYRHCDLPGLIRLPTTDEYRAAAGQRTSANPEEDWLAPL